MDAWNSSNKVPYLSPLVYHGSLFCQVYAKKNLKYISNGSRKVSRVAYSNSSRTDLSPNKDRNSNFLFLDESNNPFNFSLFSLLDFALLISFPGQ